jgi:hypothetical protein
MTMLVFQSKHAYLWENVYSLQVGARDYYNTSILLLTAVV